MIDIIYLVLNFYGCITCYYKFSGLKQHPFIRSHSVGQKFGTDVVSFPVQDFGDWSQDVGWAVLTVRGLIKEESVSTLIQIVSRIQFLAACRAEVLIFLWDFNQVLLSVARVHPSFSAIGPPPSSNPEMEFFFIESLSLSLFH